MDNEALHHTIFMIDVQNSATLRNDQKLAARAMLRAVLEDALGFAGITGGVRIEDRGDGLLGTLTAAVPKIRLLGAAVESLDRGLAKAGGRTLVRMGVHHGELHHDAWGIAGSDVDLACRLADAPVAKLTLGAAHAARLAVVVSEPVYESVVRHGGRYVEPESYRAVRVRLKEVDRTAWLRLPGYSVPPIVDRPADARETPEPGPRERGQGPAVTIHGDGAYVDRSTVHGGLHVGPSHGGDRR